MGRRYHRKCASGRSKAEGLQGGKICSAAAARRPGTGRGNFFAAQVESGACGL